MKKRWVALTIIFIIGLGVFGVMQWASKPASTQRSSVGGPSDAGVLGSSSELKPFSSPYFNTQVPADMILKTSSENPRAAIRASYLFTNSKMSPGDQAAITVGTMGLNRLTEIPGVKQRLNDSAKYEAITIPNAPEGAMSFKKVNSTEGYETAVFWQENDLSVSLVVSGSTLRQSELDQTLQSILTNWSWR